MKQNITIEQCRIDLINAAKKGHITQTKTAIKRVSKLLEGQEMSFAEFINSKDERGIDAFTAAWKNNRIGVVKFLLTLGCININKQNSEGLTLLMHVIATGNTELAKILVSSGNADINIQDTKGKRAITWAAWKGQTEILDFLLMKQPGIKQKDPNHSSTLLSWAAYGGHKNTVAFLIKNKANIEAEAQGKRTPLHYAALGGDNNLEALQYLVEAGANIEAEDTKKFTPLHCAVQIGNLKLVQYLLKAGANIRAKDTNKATPLHSSIRHGKIEVAQFLIKAGANLDAEDIKGHTALRLAVAAAYTELVKALLMHGANVEAKRHESGSTLLQMAVQKGYTEIVKLLLEYGANSEAQDKNRHTVLLVAVGKGYTEIVKLLLEHGANPEAKGHESGATALKVAVNKGHTEIVKLLLEHYANPDDNGDEFGPTALQIAVGKGNIEIIKLLLEHGADVEFTYTDGNTILHALYGASTLNFGYQDTAEIIFLIISTNPDKDILKLNNYGQSALEYIIREIKGYPAEDVIKPFLFHKDFSKYFMTLKEKYKSLLKQHFDIADTETNENAIETMKESVIKDLGITKLAQSVLNHLRSEASRGDSASETLGVNYFLKHQKDWVDFALFQKKIDNLRFQNKFGEAAFTKQIIPHLNLSQEVIVKIIGGVALVNMLQKSKAALSKINIASDTELLPIPKTLGIILSESLLYEIGQFLSLEDIREIYIISKKQQQMLLSPFALKEHQEEVALIEDIIGQDDGQLSAIGENGNYSSREDDDIVGEII